MYLQRLSSGEPFFRLLRRRAAAKVRENVVCGKKKSRNVKISGKFEKAIDFKEKI